MMINTIIVIPGLYLKGKVREHIKFIRVLGNILRYCWTVYYFLESESGMSVLRIKYEINDANVSES